MNTTAKYANHAKSWAKATAFPGDVSFRVFRVVRGSCTELLTRSCAFYFSLTNRFLQRQGLGLLIAIMPLIVGCNSSSGEFTQSKLVGTWSGIFTNANNEVCKETFTVNIDGGFTDEIVLLDPHRERVSTLTGKVSVKGNEIIFTALTHSNTNAVLPMPTQVRVVRFNNEEMDIELISTRGVRQSGAATYRRSK